MDTVAFADVDTMVNAYLDYLSNIGKGVPKHHFNPALDIFVRLRFTPLVPDVHVQADPTMTQESPCGTIQRLAPLQQEKKKRGREQEQEHDPVHHFVSH